MLFYIFIILSGKKTFHMTDSAAPYVKYAEKLMNPTQQTHNVVVEIKVNGAELDLDSLENNKRIKHHIEEIKKLVGNKKK